MRTGVVLGVIAAAALGVAALQPSLAQTLHDAKARDDVYLFPPAEELRVMTLGWDAAATDLIWAKLHVEYGMHWSEHRPFPHLERYVDAILALEPDYRPLYMYVDTLLVYRPTRGYEDDARKARAYLERGTRERPDDYRVWQHYGEFLAFLGPSWIEDEKERAEWRQTGALALLRAVDLGGDASRVVTAATVVSKRRELRAQAIDQLRRAYVVTDDPEERAEISAKIAQLEEGTSGPSSRDAIERDMAFIDRRWGRDYPFVNRGTYLIIGPVRDTLACAGRDRDLDAPECAREWDRVLPSRRDP